MKKSDSIKVSVIVSTYRRKEELTRALISLANQTINNFEIVVVDDNDDAEWNNCVKSIVDEFQKTYFHIPLTYIENHPNRGSGVTRNIGIKASQGEYITFLDDDDLYLPTKIEKQVTFMKNENLDYSITDLYLFDKRNKLIDKRVRYYISETSQKSLFENHLMHHLTGTDTMMFRKDYIATIGGFPSINIGDEFYLIQRAIEHGGKFGYLPGCDVKAYVHTGNLGLSSGQGKIDGENRLYEHKKTHFYKLSSEKIRYIKARHYAVLAYAYLRMNNIGLCIKNSIIGFLVSPILFLKILHNR